MFNPPPGVTSPYPAGNYPAGSPFQPPPGVAPPGQLSWQRNATPATAAAGVTPYPNQPPSNPNMAGGAAPMPAGSDPYNQFGLQPAQQYQGLANAMRGTPQPGMQPNSSLQYPGLSQAIQRNQSTLGNYLNRGVTPDPSVDIAGNRMPGIPRGPGAPTSNPRPNMVAGYTGVY